MICPEVKKGEDLPYYPLSYTYDYSYIKHMIWTSFTDLTATEPWNHG